MVWLFNNFWLGQQWMTGTTLIVMTQYILYTSQPRMQYHISLLPHFGYIWYRQNKDSQEQPAILWHYINNCSMLVRECCIAQFRKVKVNNFMGKYIAVKGEVLNKTLGQIMVYIYYFDSATLEKPQTICTACSLWETTLKPLERWPAISTQAFATDQ